MGQNVNSYHDISKTEIAAGHQNAEGFSETFKLRNVPGYRFGGNTEMLFKMRRNHTR